MTAPSTPMPSRGKRVLFTSLLVVVLALFADAASFVLLWATEGARPGPGRFRQARSAVREAFAAEAPRGALLAPMPGRRRIAWGDQVIHPYMGFVQKPGAFPDPRRRITDQGFVAIAEQPPVAPPASFTVGVFGGSVAQIFAFLGGDALAGELSGLPLAAGRTIRVEAYALGGFKQPQQLMALNYLLALGHPLDLVLVLDGFNDVVLPIAENLKTGVHPLYPRGWPDRVQEVPDADVLRRVGEISYLRSRRADRAGLCERGPLAWSPTCHLLWRSLDRRLAARVAALEEEVTTLPRRGRSFLVNGPPFTRPAPEALYRDLAAYWGRCSRLMADLCRSEGIPYFHFLQPNQYVAGSKVLTAEERRVAISDKELYRPYAEDGYPYLVEEGRRLGAAGVSFHDLTMVFSGVAESVYVDTCCHFNHLGNEVVAAEVGRIIRRELAGGREGGGGP